jgi:hypothetical protein
VYFEELGDSDVELMLLLYTQVVHLGGNETVANQLQIEKWGTLRSRERGVLALTLPANCATAAMSSLIMETKF